MQSRTVLSLLLFLVGCVPTPNSRTERFDGPIAPCEVKLTGEAPDVDPRGGEDIALHELGPWSAWNTHPDAGCNRNPTVETRNVITAEDADPVDELFDMELYITYPTPRDPTITGAGDVAKDKFPLLIFAHANNDRVCEIFESYYSLQDHWASWGWVVVSVDGTKFNCRRGNKLNIELRADSMVDAVERMGELNEDPESRFFERIDMSRVVMVGHSRGGGAAFVAAEEVPETIGVITIQGVDTQAFGFGTDTLTALPVLGITAGNDVDLNYPHVELVEALLGGRYAWVDITGGIHAYTADNAPLEPDDAPDISREEQHNTTEYFTTAFLFDVLGDVRGEPVLYDLSGTRGGASITSAGVFHRWRNDIDPIWVDTFDRADPATNDLGGAVSSDIDAAELSTYHPETNETSGRWSTSTSLRLESSDVGTYTTALDVAGPLDVSDAPVLQFMAKGPDEGAIARLEVVFEDAEGEHVVEMTEEHRGPKPLSNRFQQFVVPVPNPNVGQQSLSFRIGGGSLFIDNVRFDSVD